jgi:hypothetical protein
MSFSHQNFLHITNSITFLGILLPRFPDFQFSANTLIYPPNPDLKDH